MAQPPKALLAAATPEEMEQQFYEALQRGDIEAMMAVWADDDEIACIHPGGPRLLGPGPIRASFEAMFAHGGVDAQADTLRCLQLPGAAVHHVLERIELTMPDGPRSAWVVATNVYTKSAAGWRMVLHHASPGSPREMQDIIEAPSVLH